MKNSRETRLKAVKEHLDDCLTIKEVALKYGIDLGRIKFFVALYRLHGEASFINVQLNIENRSFKNV